jgi:hypothetical protein
MFRDAERKMKVVRGCPIDVYSASYMHQYSYFYKLQHAGQASEAVRDTCFEYIVDSSFQNDDIGNREVLDKACELHADTVIPKDYPGERHRTRESMKEFISMYEPSEMRPDPMIVVQPPHHEEFEQNEEFYSQFSNFALGGLHNFTPEGQVNMIKEFRDVVGDYADVHAFGVGTSLTVVQALRNNPNLVDSLDVSTAESAVINNKIPDKKWKQTPFHMPRGLASNDVRSRFSEAILYMLNYVLGPLVDDPDLQEEYYEQTTLADVADMQQQETATGAKNPRSWNGGKMMAED